MKMGIRETRQRLTQVIKRVQKGETLLITDRKLPVAKIVPLKEGEIRLNSHSKLREKIQIKGAPLSSLVLEDREPR